MAWVRLGSKDERRTAVGCRENLEAFLGNRGITFESQHHPLAFTAQKVAASEHIPDRMLAKVVMVFAGEDLTMLVLPAQFQVDLDATRAALGGRHIRLAREEEFAASFPDCEPGTMPPFGTMYGIPVYVDQALTENERFVFQAGTHTETMSIAYGDFARLVRPTVTQLGFVPGKVRRAS
jgi:Ala-tRNA(Pro) deacylase